MGESRSPRGCSGGNAVSCARMSGEACTTNQTFSVVGRDRDTGLRGWKGGLDYPIGRRDNSNSHSSIGEKSRLLPQRQAHESAFDSGLIRCESVAAC